MNLTRIRITINWTDRLLSLGACAGNLKVSAIDPLKGNNEEILMTARVAVERFSSGYKNAKWSNGLTEKEFDEYLEPVINRMMHSYHKGMLLYDLDLEWIDNWKVKDV
jgi:hypothetical protein